MRRLKCRRSGRGSCGYDERGLCVAPLSSGELEFIFCRLDGNSGTSSEKSNPSPSRLGSWSSSIRRRVLTGTAPAGSWIHLDPDSEDGDCRQPCCSRRTEKRTYQKSLDIWNRQISNEFRISPLTMGWGGEGQDGPAVRGFARNGVFLE